MVFCFFLWVNGLVFCIFIVFIYWVIVSFNGVDKIFWNWDLINVVCVEVVVWDVD